MAWPPKIEDLKDDLSREDVRDDARLARCLDAAVGFVERVHRGRYTFSGTPTVEAPAPPADMETGTIRLAGRWFHRRRSPEALISLGEYGSSRVPSFDPDIDRMLRIGRYRRSVIA